MVHRFVTSLCLLLFALGCGPTLLFPGGALDGTPASPPDDWAWTSEISTIQLETNPEDPYSVNIWIIAIDENLYVHAGANRSTWIENMESDPAVRVQIDEQVFDLSAERVEEQSEFDAFADAYSVKYGVRPRNEDVTEAYLFRLQSR